MNALRWRAGKVPEPKKGIAAKGLGMLWGGASYIGGQGVKLGGKFVKVMTVGYLGDGIVQQGQQWTGEAAAKDEIELYRVAFDIAKSNPALLNAENPEAMQERLGENHWVNRFIGLLNWSGDPYEAATVYGELIAKKPELKSKIKLPEEVRVEFISRQNEVEQLESFRKAVETGGSTSTTLGPFRALLRKLATEVKQSELGDAITYMKEATQPRLKPQPEDFALLYDCYHESSDDHTAEMEAILESAARGGSAPAKALRAERQAEAERLEAERQAQLATEAAAAVAAAKPATPARSEAITEATESPAPTTPAVAAHPKPVETPIVATVSQAASTQTASKKYDPADLDANTILNWVRSGTVAIEDLKPAQRAAAQYEAVKMLGQFAQDVIAAGGKGKTLQDCSEVTPENAVSGKKCPLKTTLLRSTWLRKGSWTKRSEWAPHAQGTIEKNMGPAYTSLDEAVTALGNPEKLVERLQKFKDFIDIAAGYEGLEKR